MLVSGVEVGYLDGEVPDARILQALRRAFSLGVNDLDHRSVGGLDEDIAVVAVIDPEPEMVGVPLRQPLGVRGSDGGVFESDEHSNSILPEATPGAGFSSSASSGTLCASALDPHPAKGPRRLYLRQRRRGRRGRPPAYLWYQQDLSGCPSAFQGPVRFCGLLEWIDVLDAKFEVAARHPIQHSAGAFQQFLPAGRVIAELGAGE